ncbi:MAG: hypothetical protein ABI925_00775 [Verrucomicrobiota bacterium]
MKPTLEIPSPTHQQNFPLTDYHYQPTTLETSHVAAKETLTTPELRGLWRLSTGFFNAEAKLDYATELLGFSIITALSVWPIITTIVAITRMVRNY